jgi:hypothetical protein
LEQVAFSYLDWSGQVLRKRPGLEIHFQARKGRDGSVAIAKAGSERSLTIDEIALLASLEPPCALPQALREQVRECDQVMTRLIFDGLVQVRRGRQFYTGAAALVQPNKGSDPPGAASPISELALQYALTIRHLQPGALAARLYAFNSLPRTISRGDSAAQFFDITGIDIQTPAPRLGGREWNLQSDKGWLYFRRGISFKARFKLYLSPQPKSIAAVIPGFTEVLGRARGSVFKIAFPVESLGRADKIVAYVPSFAALQETLSSLLQVGFDVAVQALPFSAPVPGTQLLSWGVDPPSLAAEKGSSWRSWVAHQVADCAHRIPAATTASEALDNLKMALELRDIDPIQWLPRQQLVSRKWRLDL